MTRLAASLDLKIATPHILKQTAISIMCTQKDPDTDKATGNVFTMQRIADMTGTDEKSTKTGLQDVQPGLCTHRLSAKRRSGLTLPQAKFRL